MTLVVKMHSGRGRVEERGRRGKLEKAPAPSLPPSSRRKAKVSCRGGGAAERLPEEAFPLRKELPSTPGLMLPQAIQNLLNQLSSGN